MQTIHTHNRFGECYQSGTKAMQNMQIMLNAIFLRVEYTPYVVVLGHRPASFCRYILLPFQTIDFARRGAFISMFGCCPAGEKIEVEPFQIYWKELKITGSFVNPFCFGEAVDLLKDLKAQGLLEVDKIGVQVFDLRDYKEALESLKSGKAAKAMFKL